MAESRRQILDETVTEYRKYFYVKRLSDTKNLLNIIKALKTSKS
jgi:lauroyl/myristoyl acyltransferase